MKEQLKRKFPSEKIYTPFLYTFLDTLDELHTTIVLLHPPGVSAAGQVCSTVPSNKDGSCVDYQDQYVPWSFQEETIHTEPGILSRKSNYHRRIQNIVKHLWTIFAKCPTLDVWQGSWYTSVQRKQKVNLVWAWKYNWEGLTTYPVFLKTSAIRQLCSLFREKSKNNEN